MASIEAIHARQILDSRGNPTLEVEVALDDGTIGRAGVPSGASTGAFEAVELRDGGDEYGGKAVNHAVANVIDEIQPELLGHEADDQRLVDQAMIDLDRTPDKSRLGANAIVGVSIAVARAAADSASLPVFRYLGGPNAHVLPVPMMNIMNGGAHADNSVDIQEFMIAPIGAATFEEALRWGAETYHVLKSVLKQHGLSTGVGDEGGFAPDLEHNRAALDLIVEAIEGRLHPRPRRRAGHRRRRHRVPRRPGLHLRGHDQAVGGDDQHLPGVAGHIPDRLAGGSARGRRLAGWRDMTAAVGDRVQIVGDDLRDQPAAAQPGHRRAVGQLAAGQAQPDRHGERDPGRGVGRAGAGFTCIISHRSGETDDTTISDLAVATNCGQIKTGRRPAASGWRSTTSSCGSRNCSATRPTTPAPVPTRGSRNGPDDRDRQAPPAAPSASPDEADGAGGAARGRDLRHRAQPGVPGAGVHRAAAADRPAPGDPAVHVGSGEEPPGGAAAVLGPGLHRAAGPRSAAHVLPDREVLRDHRELRAPGATAPQAKAPAPWYAKLRQSVKKADQVPAR